VLERGGRGRRRNEYILGFDDGEFLSENGSL
jgi:hypothetical protein